MCLGTYGHSSLYVSTMTDVRNIYCDGTHSCSKSTINNVNGSVYGNGLQPLWYSSITNVKDYVVGVGFGAMIYATITNIRIVCN